MIWRDLQYAARGFRNSPGYTAVALLSLALGIGSTTAIFSVVYGVLINPFPYARPNEIWSPQILGVKGRQDHVYNNGEFQQVKKLPAFSDVMATGFGGVFLIGERAPESIQAIQLSANAFQFLGVPPLLGRTIMASDIRSSGEPEPVVVLSYVAWKRIFNGDPDAINKTLHLNDKVYTVIGVMPPRFGWFGSDILWMPFPENPEDQMALTIVRLAPGTTKASAEDQLHSLNLNFSRIDPAAYPKEGFRTNLKNYMDVTVASGEMQTSLRILFGAVAFLLLIACANVANLQLARATGRAREIAVRISIGANRARLLRQMLTESLLLSVMGGALGVLMAIGTTKAIVALMPQFYVPNEARITLNIYVLIFAVGVSVLTGVLFGLAPAIQASRPDLTESLKDSGRGSGVSAASNRTRGLLVITEVALAVILLAGASLTIRSFLALHQVDVGFQPDRVLMVGLPLVSQRYATLAQRNSFAQNLVDRVKTLPGVESVAVGNGGLPFGGPQSAFSLPGVDLQTENQRLIVGLVSSDYLRTMGIPVKSGRALTEQEVAHADNVAMINETAAKLWPAGQNPIGREIRVELLVKPGGPVLTQPGIKPNVTVVGIVGDIKNNGLREKVSPSAYLPYTLLAPPQRTLAVRTKGAPMLLLNAVRQQVRDMDKDQPVGRPITMDEVMGFETIQPRFNTALFSFFASLGLSLALAGIYSVLSYHVTRRTHEIGVRMALGAEEGDVLKLMFGMGGKLVLTGLVVGTVSSLFLTRFLRNQLFGVQPVDPISIAAVALVLSFAAFLACYIPARRASRLNPVIALRHE